MNWDEDREEFGLRRPEELGMGMLGDVTSRFGGDEEGNLNWFCRSAIPPMGGRERERLAGRQSIGARDRDLLIARQSIGTSLIGSKHVSAGR